MHTTSNPYPAGTHVLISDGISTWDPAAVLSGPHQPLTSEHPMWLVQAEDGSGWLAHAGDMRVVPA